MINPWFPYNQNITSSTAIRLFCFPHLGGGASIFRNWKHHFPSNIEVYPVQLPGRETRFSEPLITSMEELVDHLSTVLFSFFDLPMGFFGHSLGALVALELVRKIERTKRSPKLTLFLSASLPPDQVEKSIPIYDLPEKEFIFHLEKYGAMPRQLIENQEALKLILPRLRADFKILNTYQFSRSILIHTPICVFGGEKDHTIPPSSLATWKAYTTGAFSSHLFSGGHFYYQEAVPELGKKITEYYKSFGCSV
jgi:medium-chain acyl-[acyl-carrier-protein] hydrolase